MGSYGDSEAVDDGLRKYQERANYQQHALQSGQFVEILVTVLQHLVFLTSVTLRPCWPFRRDIGLGSPLARSWSRADSIPTRADGASRTQMSDKVQLEPGIIGSLYLH